MNPYFIIAALIAVGVLTGGAYYQGRQDGSNAELARQKRDDDIIRISSAAAAASSAEAISKIEVKNTTIRQTLEKEVHENTMYVDCRSGDLARSLLNSTIGAAPAASAASGGGVPATGPAR